MTRHKKKDREAILGSNEHPEVYMKVRAQLERWISDKTRVTVGFYDNPLAGSLSGELAQVAGRYKEIFFEVTGAEGARLTMCPVLAETLSIENDGGYCRIEMKWRDCEVVVGPFVDTAELLKALPVPGRRPN